MADTKLNVEVHHYPLMAPGISRTKYRIYINQDLIIEREWSWGRTAYIDETIVVDLEDHSTYTIQLVYMLASDAPI